MCVCGGISSLIQSIDCLTGAREMSDDKKNNNKKKRHLAYARSIFFSPGAIIYKIHIYI